MAKAPVGIEYKGTKIQLPVINGRPMETREAVEALLYHAEQDEKEVGIHHSFACAPLDGLVAFNRALTDTYGWTELQDKQTMFGKIKPTLIGIPTAYERTEQVPWGNMSVPGIDGVFETQMETWPSPAFVLAGRIKRKHEKEVQELVELTKKNLAERSIYRGSAVKISFSYMREDRSFHPVNDAPQFMRLDSNLELNLIFGDRVARELEIGLFTPIEHKEACRKYQVPLKRGVLLAGPYGVGKTLTANVTALKATRSGWTFIYLEDVRDLKQGLEFAARYAPAILFAEDIDRTVTGERSTHMDEILNTIDGVDTKNGEIITIFTTNHVDQINPAILRPGRLDTLIHVTPPDAKAASRLVELYARDLLANGTTLDQIGQRLEGKIPAVIREVTERSKLAAISRLRGGSIEGSVTEEDLLDAANAMDSHNKLIFPDEPKRTNPEAEVFVRLPAGHPGAGKVLEAYNNGVEQ